MSEDWIAPSMMTGLPCRMRVVSLLLTLLVAGCASVTPSHPAASKPSKALILVVVDQLGSEAFSHYVPREGFLELQQRGAYFPTARYPYLHPETCVGHATIATGTYPWKHGIVKNEWAEPGNENSRYCVADEKYGRSPRALEAPTLSEILAGRGYNVTTTVVSGKDRSAIMLGGRLARKVVWYDAKRHAFVSSSYYDKPGQVVDEFNKEELWREYFLEPWKVTEKVALPYGVGLTPDDGFFGSLQRSPAIDNLTFELFARLLRETVARNKETQHVFGLSLSGLDSTGHRYGSHSIYYRSVLANVDHLLLDLIAFLDKEIGRDGYLLAVTGDHGSFPMEDDTNRRVSADEITCARLGKKCPGVAERIDFSALDSTSRWYEYARHSYFPGRSEEPVQIYAEHLIPYLGGGTSHVTPYPVDTDVPLWIMGTQLDGTSTAIVSPADIVPTFLKALGEKPMDTLDGKALL